jgi:AraC-like DNA-binding protein
MSVIDPDAARRAANATRARNRRLKAKQRKLDALALEQAPERRELERLAAVPKADLRAGDTLSADGLLYVEMLAQHHGVKLIAQSLGISRRTLKRMMDANRGDNAVMLAWEWGDAVAEDRLRQTLEKQSADGKLISTIHLGKAVHGYREGDDKNSVNINTGIQLVLPQSMSMAELLKQRGMTAPLEVVSTDHTDKPWREISAPVAVIDTTPDPEPAPPPPKLPPLPGLPMGFDPRCQHNDGSPMSEQQIIAAEKARENLAV